MPINPNHTSALLLACGLLTGVFPNRCAADTPAAQAYPATSVDMPVRKISDHVYYVQGKPGMATDNEGFISNAGFVVTGGGVVVFDSLGTPPLADRLVARIREITREPVVRIVVSHYHADHVYGLQVFRDLGAEIIAPAGSERYLQSDAAQARLEERRASLDPWVNDNTRLVEPDRLISETTTFTLGAVTFNLNYLGSAHSDGDMAMFIEPDRVLFSGDIIFEGRVPFVGNADTRHWLETLEEMETGGVRALIPGHGPASTRPAETISLTRRYLAWLRESMGAAVEEFRPFAEAYDGTDWSQFRDLPAFDEANRTNAYQVYLSMEAEMLAR